MTCKEAEELISALVDNELNDLERQATDSHLKNCSGCQYRYEQEKELKKQLYSIGAKVSAPSDLRAKILSDHRILPQATEPSQGWKGFSWAPHFITRPAFALAVLMVLLVPIFYVIWPTGQPIPLAALEAHAKITSGDLSFVRAENPAEIKNELYRATGGKFAPMGYDLSPIGLRAVGSTVREVSDREILIAIYEGTGPSVSCFTFLGTEKDAPPKARLYFDPEKKINFYTFSNDGINGVMHRVGERICLLISKRPIHELLDIARSVSKPTRS